MFIDLHRLESLKDLLDGYLKIKNARQVLIGKWRFELLKAYVKRWDRYAQKLAIQSVRRARLKRYLPWTIVGLSVLCGLSYFLAMKTSFCLGTLLMLAVFMGFAFLMVLWVAFSQSPKEPEHPLAQNSKKQFHAPLKKRLFPDLLPLWRREITDPIPGEDEVEQMANAEGKYGLLGEYALIRALSEIISPDSVILHSVMPKKKDDLDVVVIGPKGIWYFEVKYINAHIEWRNGEWAMGKLNYTTGEFQFEDMNEYPDKQWIRMRKELVQNLNIKWHGLLAKYPNIGKIKGGLVFAHPKATFDIEKSPPFSWGRTNAWINEYAKAPRMKEMSPIVIMQLTEIILAKHQTLNPNQKVYSAKASASKVLQSQEQNIQGWIRASQNEVK